MPRGAPRPSRSSLRPRAAVRAAAGLLALALWPPAGPARGGSPADAAVAGPDTTAGAPDAAAGPAWPLRLPTRYLTSNFMEFREGRFHAGIDLKTDQRTGLPVLAAEDGWVEELRAQPEGYGRAVLLRGRSGRRYLYAHLERFADPLRARVEAAQRAAGRYRVDLRPPPGSLPVRRGEVLALSGQSGTVGPHVHLEVRNAGGMALDPLRHGFAPPDSFPPAILRLRALPASPGAWVEGGGAGVSLADSAGLAGELPPLAVSGPVALAADLLETADSRRHRLAPSSVTVRLDGAEVFAARNDSFPLAEQAQRRLEWLEAGALREIWLWRHPADTLPGRRGGPWCLAGDGLRPGRHRVEIEVGDAAGHVARVAWWLDVAASDAPRPGAGAPGRGAWRPDPVVLGGVAAGAGPLALTPFLEQGAAPGEWRDPWRSASAVEPAGWTRRVLAPGQDLPLLAPLALYVAADSVLPAEARAAREAQGLADPGPVALLMAPQWPAAGRVPVTWPGSGPAGAAGPRDGVYREAEPGVWRWTGRPLPSVPPVAGEGPGFAASGPGRYAVWRDGQPPRIGDGPSGGAVRRLAARRQGGVSLPRWETLAVTVADAGAGVDPDGVTATLDGAPLVVEPDLPRDRILVELPDDLPPGLHVLALRVADRAGNVARRRLDLDCGAAP